MPPTLVARETLIFFDSQSSFSTRIKLVSQDNNVDSLLPERSQANY